MNLPEDDQTRRRTVLLIGAAGAVVATLLGMLSPHDGAVWRAPQVLRERVSTALSAAGYGGLDVRMQGQHAVLSGIVENETDIPAAQRAAMNAAGAGGAWAGGVTSVDVEGVEVGRFDSPYVWSVRRDGTTVILSGAAPSESAKTQLVETATAAFPNVVPVDQMRVAGGAPSAHFTDVARDAVRALAQLNSGEARIVDSQIVFIGDGAQAGVDALRRTFDAPPAPFHSRLAVTVDGLDVDHPELQGLNLVGGDAETCERAFDRMTDSNVITFDENSAEIAPSNRRVLDALASVALRCDRFSIEVAGHTDNQGARDLNMDLSQARADAVSEHLARRGVARSRLSARGYGPDRPRASNASEAGRAANRRIEFYVSS